MEPERDKLRDEIGVDSFQFVEEIQNLISVPPEAGSSFTALLELPANQAVKLLHSPGSEGNTRSQSYDCTAYFMPDIPIADGRPNLAWPETNAISIPADFEEVKQEPVDSDSLLNSSLILSDPVVSKSTKRKERDKKVKSTKKSKSTEKEINKDADNLPYVHVRARRGQATDSHSLAERARREKINARMKLLQELVPGCNKISGTAMVLDEIINHVQSLQRQVEFLSMRLAAVHPRIDINLDSLFTAETGSLMDYNFPGMVSSSLWVEGQINGNVQQYQKLWHSAAVHQPVWGREEGNPNFIIPENTLMSYDSSANSACLHRNQLKMEI